MKIKIIQSNRKNKDISFFECKICIAFLHSRFKKTLPIDIYTLYKYLYMYTYITIYLSRIQYLRRNFIFCISNFWVFIYFYSNICNHKLRWTRRLRILTLFFKYFENVLSYFKFLNDRYKYVLRISII